MILRLILLAPVLIVLVLFALSNTQPVALHLWPTDYAVTTPLSVAILVGCAVTFFFGALFIWLPSLGLRARARRAERRLRDVEARERELELKLQGMETRLEYAMARASAPMAGGASSSGALARTG